MTKHFLQADSLIGLGFKTLGDKIFGLFWDRLLDCEGLENRDWAGSLPGYTCMKHEIEDDSDGPDINFVIIFLAVNLGGFEAFSPEIEGIEIGLVRKACPGYAEISDL